MRQGANVGPRSGVRPSIVNCTCIIKMTNISSIWL